jgi:hypothetical protein
VKGTAKISGTTIQRNTYKVVKIKGALNEVLLRCTLYKVTKSFKPAALVPIRVNHQQADGTRT